MWNNHSGLDDFGGGNSAGGFMDTSGMGISPSQKPRAFKSKGIVPMSVAGIRKGLQVDNTLRIGQEKVDMVSILGLITSVKMQSTVVTFKVDDMTSEPLDIKQWVEQNGDMSLMMKPLVENCYVHIMGSIRSTNGEFYMVANKVLSMVDLNELTTHLVDVIHAKMLLTRGLQSNIATNVARVGSTGVNAGSKGLTPQQEKVFQHVSSYNDEKGCSVDEVMHIMGGMSRDALKKILAFLSEEGHIYSTTDEDHFRAT